MKTYKLIALAFILMVGSCVNPNQKEYLVHRQVVYKSITGEVDTLNLEILTNDSTDLNIYMNEGNLYFLHNSFERETLLSNIIWYKINR